MNMNIVSPQCAARSVGVTNNLFGIMLQTVLLSQCNISPVDKWPRDFGKRAMKGGS